jgi:hypothetical protein
VRHLVNRHQRSIDAPADEVGALLATLGQADDRLWPADAWTPMVLDGPVAVGARGGHGPIRYHVSAYEPGTRVRFTFEPQVGIDGYHEFAVVSLAPDRCMLRHVLTGELRGRLRVLMPLVVERLHDAVLEDLLDRAELAATGRVARRARWSWWVRGLQRLGAPQPREVAVPDAARLARAAFEREDLVDAWRLPRPAETSSDPQVWADAMFRDVPGWVSALLCLRQLLVGIVGIERGGPSAFDTLQVEGPELLLGTDADHLDFRASILVEPRTVTLTTVARANNRRGQAYLTVIEPFHRRVVPAMLRRAGRLISGDAPAGPEVLPLGREQSPDTT